jgi:aspartyl-tRNA(Asn)/glutamyl-tRNA(Gln) amidotransferase subunit C
MSAPDPQLPFPSSAGASPVGASSIEPHQDLAQRVRAIAALARLDIQAEEAEALGAQFGRTLEHFQVLSKLDVDGVEPMIGAGSGSSVLRDDTPEPSFAPERMLANAPARVGDFYRVPKTVGGEE